MLSLKLLGAVEVSLNSKVLRGFRSQKEPAILIYLAQTGQPQRRETLAELLWESSSTEQSLSNLRTALTRLQKQVGDVLDVSHRSLALAPTVQHQVDSVMLPQVLAGVGPIESAEQARDLQTVLANYRGDFLADFQLRNAPCFDSWVATTREAVRREVLAAYAKLGQYALSGADVPGGIALARRWLQVDALDEAAHTLLIRLLLAAGDRREAVAHYDACAALFRSELGVAPPAAMSALLREARPTPSVTPRPQAAARHNLPAAYDRFVGRERVQQELHQRLDQPWCRLATIVGPGGVGKTRLATTIARSRLGRYPDGVWLVELANLDPNDDNLAEAMAVEIATTLDLRFAGSASPAEQLLAHMEHKRLLLVLDNFEQLLDGAQLVLDVVQRCEGVQLLVTSREPLRLRAEWTVALVGLSFPSDGRDASHSEAVELFVARRAQQQWHALADHDLDAVRTICRMVEGLPLAVELAAALAASVAPQAIVEQLHQGFDVLRSTLHDLPQRHHSLAIMFELSWRMLAPELQTRLARLAVFRGGFALPAAQQVTDADAEQLAALAETSLLARNEARDRYTLHPVIRAYAAERLPADDRAADKHTRFFLALLAQHSAPLQGSRPQLSIAALEPDIDNLRLAWQSGLTTGQADQLTPALASLSTYYQLRGLAQEGESVMQATAASATGWGDAGAALATYAGLERARFQNRLGRYWLAIMTLKAAVQLARQRGDRWAEGMAHVLWGEALWRLGEYDASRSKLAQALAVAHASDATRIVGWCHHHLGVIDDIQGRYDAAHEHLQRACAAWRSLDNASALSVSLNSLGLVCYHQGELQAALETLKSAMALCTQLDNRHMQALLLNNLSLVATERGDYAGAHFYLQLGLELAIVSGNLTAQGEIRTSLGKNYRLLGKTDSALENLEQGRRIAEALGYRSLMATAMRSLAEITWKQGDAQSAEALYHQALYTVKQDRLPLLECEILISMAEFFSNNSRSQARKYSEEAVALAESLGNPRLLEQAKAIVYALKLPADNNKQNLSA